MIEKNIEFLNSKTEKLSGILTLPDGEPKAKALLAHGMFYYKSEDGVFDHLAEKLAKAGVASLRFDFTAHGESQGNSIDFTLEQELSDFSKAYSYLNSAFPQTKKTVLIGTSFGCVPVVLSRLQADAVVLLNPSVSGVTRRNTYDRFVENWEALLEKQGYIKHWKKGYKISKTFMKEILEINLVEHAGKLKGPLLFVHGDKDELAPIKESKELFAAANEPKKFVTLHGAAHGFHTKKSEAQMIKAVLDWLKKTL